MFRCVSWCASTCAVLSRLITGVTARSPLPSAVPFHLLTKSAEGDVIAASHLLAERAEGVASVSSAPSAPSAPSRVRLLRDGASTTLMTEGDGMSEGDGIPSTTLMTEGDIMTRRVVPLEPQESHNDAQSCASPHYHP